MQNFITACLWLTAVISPIAVAIINNFHNKKMRSKELAHIETLKKLEYEHSLSEKKLSLSFQNKMDAFSDLVDVYIRFLKNDRDMDLFSELTLAAAKAAMYCSSDMTANGVLATLYALPAKFDDDSFGLLKARIESLIHSLQIELNADNPTKEWSE